MEMYIEKPNDIVVTQAINYEWTPQFCHECMKLGHKNKKYNTEKQPQTAKRQQRRRRPTLPTWQAKTHKVLKDKTKSVAKGKQKCTKHDSSQRRKDTPYQMVVGSRVRNKHTDLKTQNQNTHTSNTFIPLDE